MPPPKKKKRTFDNLVGKAPPLPFFSGQRIVMQQEIYYQEKDAPRLPVFFQETTPGKYYLAVTLENGQQVAIRGPYVTRARAEQEFLDWKPGDMVDEIKGSRPRSRKRLKGKYKGKRPGRLPGSPKGYGKV